MHMIYKKKYKNIYILTLFTILTGCFEPPTAEEKSARFNKKYGPDIQLDTNGNLSLNLSSKIWSIRKSWKKNKQISMPAVQFYIPGSFKPKYSTNGNRKTVYFNFTLKNLTPWDSPPPIPHAVAENVKIYSSPKRLIGLPPDTIDDPEVHKKIIDTMEYNRKHLYVAINLERYIAGLITKTPLYGRIADGEFDGLIRYSAVKCFSKYRLSPNSNRPKDKEYFRLRHILKHKPKDDPTPSNCAAFRGDAIFLSKQGTILEERVYMNCSQYIQKCRIYFLAGHREVSTKIYLKDFSNWRETVEPLRNQINSFVIKSNPTVNLKIDMNEDTTNTTGKTTQKKSSLENTQIKENEINGTKNVTKDSNCLSIESTLNLSRSKLEVHVVGAYQGDYPDDANYFGGYERQGIVDIKIIKQNKPLILIFYSYRPINWRISCAENVVIRKIILDSYYESEATGLNNKIEILKYNFGSSKKNKFDNFYDNKAKNYSFNNFGIHPKTFQYQYSGLKFIIQ